MRNTRVLRQRRPAEWETHRKRLNDVGADHTENAPARPSPSRGGAAPVDVAGLGYHGTLAVAHAVEQTGEYLGLCGGDVDV